MNTKYHDILVAKEFETRQNGQIEHRKVWNKVGQAWETKTTGCYNFELFLMPGQRYFIKMRSDDFKDEFKDQVTENTPF